MIPEYYKRFTPREKQLFALLHFQDKEIAWILKLRITSVRVYTCTLRLKSRKSRYQMIADYARMELYEKLHRVPIARAV